MILRRSARWLPSSLAILFVGGLWSSRAESFLTNVVDGRYSNAAAGLVIGQTGPSNALVIRAGGRVDAPSSVLGLGPEAHANLAWVTDPGTLWDNSVSLTIGQAGCANWLVVTNGARVNGMRTALGQSPSSAGNRVTLTGPGTVWTCFGGLYVGEAGASNEVRILARAKAYSAGTVAVGWMAPASDNVLVMSGLESGLTHGGSLAVGSYGAARNRMEVSGGAAVFSLYGTIGNGPDNSVWLTDPGSLWQLDSLLLVGHGGAGNLLVLSNGARLLCSSAVVAGTGNRAVVTGSGSVWDTGSTRAQLVIGGTGPSNCLIVSQGGRVNSFDAYISGSSNAVRLIGPDSTWAVGGLLSVGEEFGRSNSLTITDGGQLTCFQAVLAGDGGTATVAGLDSVWVVTNLLSVGGDSGLGNQLNILDGGQVCSGAGYVGGADTPFGPHDRNVGNAVVVSGPGALWSNTTVLVVGSTGARSRLVLSQGGTVLSAQAYVGYYGSSSDNLVWVTDSPTRWETTGDLWVGYRGWRNGVVVTNGAAVASGGGWIGGRNTRGNAVQLTGPGSVWRVAGALVVGNGGWSSRLELRDGAEVSCATLLLDSPYEPNPGLSNTVVVTGSNAVLTVAENTTVGLSSSVNELRVEAGGTFRTPNLRLGSPTSWENRLELTGGTLVVTNRTRTGTLQLRRGSMALEQGTVVVDRLWADAQSTLGLVAGLLRIQAASSVAATQALELGLAGGALELQLPGGSHDIAGGIVAGSNTVLTAAGTLLSDVETAGTLQIGSNLGSLTIGGQLRLRDSAVVIWELAGPGRGTEHDFLRVSNTVSLGGHLRVRLVAGYVPASNAVITLMEFGAAEGQFANAPHGSRIALLDSPVTAQVDYGPTTLRLVNFENAAPATDHIDPAWALRYFGHSPLTDEEQQADPDGDGLTNLQEYLAGTDPLDPGSVLKIGHWARVAPDRFVLRFPCVENRSYTISVSSDLTTWQTVLAPELTQPAPGWCEWCDDGTQTGGWPTNGARFYRVGVR